jgi:hypothetical protein
METISTCATTHRRYFRAIQFLIIIPIPVEYPTDRLLIRPCASITK